MQASKRIVCVGGGHCNCQVLKLLKQLRGSVNVPTEMTLVNEAPASYYSGMLPGTVSKLYSDSDLKIEMGPLAKWCGADYIEERVKIIRANENLVELESGRTVDYDVLVMNVGSKTRGAKNVPGVWEHSLTTRPINDLIPKITRKEQELLAAGIIPNVVVCGAGAAGTELAFAFKARWEQVFGQEIDVTLVSSHDTVLHGEPQPAVQLTTARLLAKNINVIYNQHIATIDERGVTLTDGTFISATVPVWATGAEAQKVTAESDLDVLNGYFRVNDFLQSTSHPNVFAGGDCITMESYAEEHFPPKAGVYAVREGPFIARNVAHFLNEEPLEAYVPQRTFLSLLMTGDSSAIGHKFGIAFEGKWVWKMKDYIDMSFMDLFTPQHLFRDYATKGTAEPIENNELFEEDRKEVEAMLGPIRERVATMEAADAARLFQASQDEEEFHERLLMIQRMNADDPFADEVIANYHQQVKGV